MTVDEPLPDLGLPLYGLRTWMLGSRVLSFDVTPIGKLELRVEDRVLRRFPTGATGDSDGMLESAKQEWDALRPLAHKTVKRAKATLLAAMDQQQSWSLEDFNDQVRNHPVMRRLGSRLVWAGVDADGEPLCHGRLMLHGEWDLGPGRPNTLPEEVVSVMLPFHTALPEPVRRSWSARFATQPIPQLPQGSADR